MAREQIKNLEEKWKKSDVPNRYANDVNEQMLKGIF